MGRAPRAITIIDDGADQQPNDFRILADRNGLIGNLDFQAGVQAGHRVARRVERTGPAHLMR